MDQFEKVENMRFSEYSQIFLNALTAMFAQGIESDEDAQFAKMQIDYIVNMIRNCAHLGLGNKLMPIANFSLWQGAVVEDEIFFTFRKETVKFGKPISDSLKKLEDMMQKTFNEWSDKYFKGAVHVDEVESDDIKWDFPKAKEEEE